MLQPISSLNWYDISDPASPDLDDRIAGVLLYFRRKHWF